MISYLRMISRNQFNSLIKPPECIGLNHADLVLIQREYLQCIQSLERPIVYLPDAVVIQIEDQQVMEILQGRGGHVHH